MGWIGSDLNKIEHFIMKQDSSVVKTIKKHAAGQSGYITDKRAEYLMHYREEDGRNRFVGGRSYGSSGK